MECFVENTNVFLYVLFYVIYDLHIPATDLIKQSWNIFILIYMLQKYENNGK